MKHPRVNHPPRPAYVAENETKLKREGGKIWSCVRRKWLVETPEEYVRQQYLLVLLYEYGYGLEQIAEEEEVTGRGSGKARADFVVWRSSQDKAGRKSPLIIVECKSDNVTIQPEDYTQGDNYARLTNAPFFLTHNNTETKFWRVRKDRMPGYLEEIEDVPHADATNEEIEELLTRLKTFKEDEFAALLRQCHNVIRNREKKDPVAAFDEMAKILFIKVFVERQLKQRQRRKNLFTVEFLEEQLADNPLEDLFRRTKEHYREDRIFAEDEHLNLKPATGIEIVRLLERYNLSDTSEDIKGIAFERFLGRTFRGEIGQFFTPRPIVEFMVRMLDPKEGEVICDPASGSGGFLTRFFEIVRERILADVDRQYREFRSEVESNKQQTQEEKAEALRAKYAELQKTLDNDTRGSRLWNLANRCIYGTDANDRMARTSKMNMIMHGDGHGGVHHHDGFLNVNGIFEGRFDIILTNPPFGSSVEPSDTVLEEQVTLSHELEHHYANIYGDHYCDALSHLRAATGKPIASLFELPTLKGNRKVGKVKTELLFIERCLDLLKPGGRLGIVLPEGVFNNPSLAYVREFCEDRAFIQAVVSLPPETFVSSGASVKASLLFMQKFAREEQTDFNTKKAAAEQETREKYVPEIAERTGTLEAAIAEAQKDKAYTDRRKALKVELKQYQRETEAKIRTEARTLLKSRFPYPVFLYEAAHVGITATGETDHVPNELVPGDYTPEGMEKTTLELYQEFGTNPEALSLWQSRVIGVSPFPDCFRIAFSDTHRWDPGSFCLLDWRWEPSILNPIGSVVKLRREKVDRNRHSFTSLQPITIHFDGSLDKRSVTPDKEYSMDLFFARPGDLVVAKIDLKNGAVGVVPTDWENVVVTGHFAVYEVASEKVLVQWLHRIIQQPDFKEYLWRNKVGAEGRKEVKLDFFESIPIPLPDIATQEAILMERDLIQSEVDRLTQLLTESESHLTEMIHGRTPPRQK